MAWNKFVVQANTASAGTGLKATLRKMKASPVSLGLTINDVTAKALGWADGDKLEVMIGDGAQHGRLRLRKNNSVGTALVVGRRALHDSNYFRVTLGHVPAFVNRSEPAKWAQFEQVADGWTEIILPRWSLDTAPAGSQPAGVPAVRPSIAVAPSVAQAATFERPKRNNTASLMGDPPADRSALAEKRVGARG